MTIERLARLAAGAEPPVLDDLAERRMLDRAIAAAARPTVVRAPRWPVAIAVAAVVAAVVVIAWPRADAPALELSRVVLPTGDRLVGAGARFDLEAVAPAARRVRLHEGTMTFAVAHVVPHQRFEVIADRVTVVATGTVFAVTIDANATRVHVYEGRVEVDDGARRFAVSTGESWSTRDEPLLADRATGSDGAGRDRAIGSGVAVADSDRAIGSGVAVATGVGANNEPNGSGSSGNGTFQRNDPWRSAAPRRQKSFSAPMAADPDTASPLATARAALAAGHFDDALAIAQRIPDRDGAWLLVEADALRGLGKLAEAADALERAVGKLAGAARLEAAYSAAYLRFHDLHDATRALAALDLADVTDVGSPFAERGLGLRTQILVALGRNADAAEAATHYLDRFPRGDLARYMDTIRKK
jgi:hypothetical protein